MPFTQVHSEKLAEAVIRQIEELILRGVLRPGERLPSERDLSERMGVSRPSLRNAIAELHERRLLESRAGSGVYVAQDLDALFPPALTRLFSTHEEAVDDYLDFRRDMEGLAAERAARNGSDTDLKVVDAVFQKMLNARNTENAKKASELDAEFHLAIIEASHNVVMVHMMRSMFDLLKQGIFFNRQVMFRQTVTHNHLNNQHKAINDAIQARDPEAARAAMNTHLDYVRSAIDAQRLTDRNEAIAQLRLQHEATR